MIIHSSSNEASCDPEYGADSPETSLIAYANYVDEVSDKCLDF